MKILKSFLCLGGKRTPDDELIEIFGKEVFHAADGAILLVRDGETRSVVVQFIGRDTIPGEAEKLKEYLAKTFPEASEKDIKRAWILLLNRIAARLQSMDFGRRGNNRSRRNFASDWDSSVTTGRGPTEI